MKGLNAQQTQLLINYLSDNINSKRLTAEDYRKDNKYQHALIMESEAAELDCALAYLMGLIHGED